jgi:hypothetical protein
MNEDPTTELPPETFGERGGQGTQDEPTVDQDACDPQPGISNRPNEEETREEFKRPERARP